MFHSRMWRWSSVPLGWPGVSWFLIVVLLATSAIVTCLGRLYAWVCWRFGGEARTVNGMTFLGILGDSRSVSTVLTHSTFIIVSNGLSVKSFSLWGLPKIFHFPSVFVMIRYYYYLGMLFYLLIIVLVVVLIVVSLIVIIVVVFLRPFLK